MSPHEEPLSEEAKAQAGLTENDSIASARIEGRRREALINVGDGSRIRIDENWLDLRDEDAAEAFVTRDARTGLALSGGGIRSATISLGLIEALAARGRFYGFDLLSTVSGGGYCGSFVRSLYIGRVRSEEVVTEPADLADATLTSLPDQQFFRGEPGQSAFVVEGKSIKNPLWWLRENGRYLAPGGMSDYGYALSYIVRNWLTLLLYVLAVMMVAFAALQLALVGLSQLIFSADPASVASLYAAMESSGLRSPLWPMLALAGVIGTGIAAAYWLSIPLPFSRPSKGENSGIGRVKIAGIIVLLSTLFAWVIWLHANGKLPTDTAARIWTFAFLLALASALVSAALTFVGLLGRGASTTRVDFRREQTRLLTNFNALFLILFTATLIDWAALSLRDYLAINSALLSTSAFSTALISMTSSSSQSCRTGWAAMAQLSANFSSVMRGRGHLSRRSSFSSRSRCWQTCSCLNSFGEERLGHPRRTSIGVFSVE